MVKVFILAVILTGCELAVAQSLSIGGRISSGIGSSFTTGSPRDYYILASERYQIRTSGAGYLKLNSFMPPEVFLRYQSKNRFFAQIGAAFIATRVLTYYGLDSQVEDLYNPDRLPEEGLLGRMPKDHIGTRAFYFTPNLAFNYFFLKGTVIRPYIGIGVSPAILQSYDYLVTGMEAEVILQDFGRRNEVVWNARGVFGLQFYDLHVDFHLHSNVTPIDSGTGSYNKRATTFYLALGYNLLNFNLVKKTRS